MEKKWNEYNLYEELSIDLKNFTQKEKDHLWCTCKYYAIFADSYEDALKRMQIEIDALLLDREEEEEGGTIK